jgi:hypothetical protein
MYSRSIAQKKNTLTNTNRYYSSTERIKIIPEIKLKYFSLFFVEMYGILKKAREVSIFTQENKTNVSDPDPGRPQ